MRADYRWEDTAEMDLREIRCDDVDYIHLTQNRDQWLVLVNTNMNL
jgi:hypothetical protein